MISQSIDRVTQAITFYECLQAKKWCRVSRLSLCSIHLFRVNDCYTFLRIRQQKFSNSPHPLYFCCYFVSVVTSPTRANELLFILSFTSSDGLS